MYSFQEERRDLGHGWYAVKRPSEHQWTLKREGVFDFFYRGKIRELELWIKTREEWRQSIERSSQQP